MRIGLVVISLLLLAGMSFWRCGDNDEPLPPQPECGPGYEVLGDTCFCSPDRIEVFGTCRALRAHEYWGVTSDCICKDTILFRLLGYSVWQGQLQMHMEVLSGGSPTPSHTSVPYYISPDGDSFHAEFYYKPFCAINGKTHIREVYAKQWKPNEWRFNILYVDHSTGPRILVDSCVTYLRR